MSFAHRPDRPDRNNRDSQGSQGSQGSRGGRDGRVLLSTEELAHWLGIPLATLYQWHSKGIGPPRIRIGKHVRYRPADVERWLEAQYVKDR